MALLRNVRRSCLIIWLIFSLIVFIITLLQTMTGKLFGIESYAWTWIILNTSPGLLILVFSFIRAPLTLQTIPFSFANLLRIGTFGYGFIVVGTILMQPFISPTSMSLKRYLIISYWWLSAYQFLLMPSLIWSFLFKAIVVPTQKNIREAALGYAQRWEKKGDEFKNTICLQIAEGNYNEAFELLNQHFTSNQDQRLNDLILLQGEYNTTQRSLDLNLIERNEAQRTFNRITMALLRMIDNIP